ATTLLPPACSTSLPSLRVCRGDQRCAVGAARERTCGCPSCSVGAADGAGLCPCRAGGCLSRAQWTDSRENGGGRGSPTRNKWRQSLLALSVLCFTLLSSPTSRPSFANMETDMPSPKRHDAGAVLLVNPRMSGPGNRRLPLSVLNLAAILEGRHPWQILDGNRGPITGDALAALAERPHALVGVTVMPGPQVAPAIEISAAIRAAFPSVPIVWGGYFPTLYPDAAINAPYVDFLVRGQGEATLLDLLARLPGAGPPSAIDSARDSTAVADVAGLTWKRDGRAVHNPERPLVNPDTLPPLPYERLQDMRGYLRPTFM